MFTPWWPMLIRLEWSPAVWWSIGGTLSDQTDLQDALDLKLNIQAQSSTGTTISFDDDTIHGSYNAPLVGNLSADLVTFTPVRWVVNKIFHNDTSAPVFNNFDSVNWTYIPSQINYIQAEYDWSSVVAFISQLS